MSIADRLDGKRVVICAGSGGVGKTTTSAALAMGLAASGKRVAVVTIDPARRLADSQEFTAIAKLYDLDRSGDYDVLVLDTPPSRNALDFLDAPDRLTSFFEGRALRLVLIPTRIAARIMSRGTSV